MRIYRNTNKRKKGAREKGGRCIHFSRYSPAESRKLSDLLQQKVRQPQESLLLLPPSGWSRLTQSSSFHIHISPPGSAGALLRAVLPEPNAGCGEEPDPFSCAWAHLSNSSAWNLSTNPLITVSPSWNDNGLPHFWPSSLFFFPSD